VTVSFYATLRSIVGAKRLEIDLPEGASLRDLLGALVERCPALAEKLFDGSGALSRHVQIFVDGRGAAFLPNGLDTKLRAHDAIDIFPAVAGGQTMPTSSSRDLGTTPSRQPRAS
jgi:molybdopterin synthase sulfur carrier subunit